MNDPSVAVSFEDTAQTRADHGRAERLVQETITRFSIWTPRWQLTSPRRALLFTGFAWLSIAVIALRFTCAPVTTDVLAFLAATLLDVTRLQAGARSVFPRPADLEEIITCSLVGLGPSGRTVRVDLVAAGLFSVILFPIISLQLLRSSAKGPGMVPEQAHVRRRTCPQIRAHAAGVQLSDAGSMPAERATTAHFGGHMSKPPLPEAAVAMLRKPNPAVITTLRPDGQPVSTATWYLWDDGRVLVNMDEGRKRLEHMRSDPRVALDVLDESGWYTHLSITGHVDEMRDDVDLADIDRLARQYMGKPYPQRERRRISAWIAVDGWHGWGALKDSSQPG